VGKAGERAPRVPPAPEPLAVAARVPRVVVIAPDLMFGSRIEETLRTAGHEVTLSPSASEAPLDRADLLIADLDTEAPEALVGLGIPVLGYYSHVNVATRRMAEAAGVDLVAPRSRMAREMIELVAGLVG
jgi:hypothetical protein